MIFGRLIKSLMVKDARGFSPTKTVKGTDGATVYQVSLSLLDTVLIKHARSNGVIDEKRAYVLERVHGHFDEHVMFNASPANIAMGVLSDMSQDYDHMGRNAFESLYERSSREIAPKLPDVVNKEIVAHLALFQRVDTVPLSNLDRESSVRDLHALLFGRVSQQDVQEAMNVAAGYTIDHR